MNSLLIDNSEVIVTVLEESVNINVCESIIDVSIGETGPQGPRGTQVLSGTIDPTEEVGLIGDQYINTSSGLLFGPKTESGWGVGIFIAHPDPNVLGQVYIQTTPSDEWNIVHTLSFVPNVTIIDSAGTVFEGDYQYVTDNHIIARFSFATAGKAFLS